VILMGMEKIWLTHVFILFGPSNGYYSDVKSATILNVVSQDYSGDAEENKVITLNNEADGKEEIVLKKKESIFNKNFKIKECAKTCEETKLNEVEQEALGDCIFEGKLKSDKDSTVQVHGCEDKGHAIDISLLSEKANLKYNSYRIHNNGTIETDSEAKFTDVPSSKALSEKGSDYEDDFLEDEPPLKFVNSRGETVSYVRVEKPGAESCCRATKSKCYESKNAGVEKSCSTTMGKIKCGDECQRMIKMLKAYEKRSNEYMTLLNMTRGNEHKNISKGKMKTLAESEQMKTLAESQPMKKQKQSESHYDDEESEYDSETYDDEPNKDEHKVKKPPQKVEKKGLTISYKDLKKIESAVTRKKGTNPKCKKARSMFRSRSLSYQSVLECAHHPFTPCRQKDPVPTKKEYIIYKKNTIEIGVVVDRHFYKVIADAIKSTDKEKVRKAILEYIKKLMNGVEPYLNHQSFTTKGGFSLKINGVIIFNEKTDLNEKWETFQSGQKMLQEFRLFANKVNEACDAEPESYDAMLLLTGRYDYTEINGGGGSFGYAFTGAVCQTAASMMISARADDKGDPKPVMSQVLAHEFGHILGSGHDGEPDKHNAALWPGGKVPCAGDKYLMAKSVDTTMKVWSDCTRKMIDSNYQDREKKKHNCFRT